MAPAWFPFSLVLVTALIGTVVVTFGAAVLRARDRDDPSPVVRLTLWLAAIWAAASVVGALVVVLTTLLQPSIHITVPVQEFWPQLPDRVVIDGPTATRDGGGFRWADLMARDVSAGVRVTWAISQALAWVVPGTIAAMIAVACFQLLAGRAFAPVVARMAMITAIVVAAGGVAAQMLGDVAGSMAATELFFVGASQSPADIDGIDDVLQAWWPQPAGFALTLPFWPIAAGLAFAALAAILRYGSRLQRDTEGLV